ncbi:Uncharacterized tRNA/rRNA methyltransferase YfiF at C-terminar half [Coccomyxa sp. Obi]|nr:Uncharacterized tRNA/rRNA methyltransferase YfiF at C-terminar half [Coccomyxa sp. Obi]
MNSLQAQVRRSLGSLGNLPLPAVCHLVRSILQEQPPSAASHEVTSEQDTPPSHFTACFPGTVRAHGSSPRAHLNGHQEALSGGQQWQGAHYVQALGVKLLLRRTLGMLGSSSESDRKAAQRVLLPSCLHAAAAVGGQLCQLALLAVWERCRLLILEPGVLLLDMVLSILVQHAELLLPTMDDGETTEMPEQGRNLDLRSEEDFWPLVRRALGSAEHATCKKGLCLLRAALPSAAVEEAPWSVFLSLYELIDEYPLHLIQVQRLVVQSFLDRDWSPVRLGSLSPAFVVQKLLRTVSQPVMLLKGDGEGLMQRAERLVSHYMASASSDTQRTLLEALMESQTVQSQPRATRKAMISCLAAAAEAAAPIDDTAWFSHAIAQLRAIVSTFHFYGSPSLTADLCRGTVRTASALGRPPSMALSSAVPLLQELPRDAVRPGGPLHQPVRDWLLGSEQDSHTDWYFNGLSDNLEDYFSSSASVEAQSAVTADDLAAWASTADKWARLMMIGAHAEGALKERLLQALEDQTQQLYRRPYLRRGTAERTLILLNALFEAKPSAHCALFKSLAGRRVAGVSAGGTGSVPWLSARLARLAEESAEELSAYTAASLQFFWTSVESPRAASQGMTFSQWSTGASSSLPAEVQASVARARLALGCTQLATLCLLRCAAPDDSLREAAARAVDMLQRPTMKFVQCFALTPLPLPGGRRLSEDGRLPRHVTDSYMQLHAHALGCMAEACSGLAATNDALHSLGRAFTSIPNLEAVVQALLRNPLAAIPAEASSSCFSAEAETDRWRAMEGVLRLASSRSAPGSRSFAGTTRVRILADILQALDAAHDDTLMTLLHCLRLALADVVRTPVLLPAAEAALGLQPAHGASDGNRLAALVGAAARGAWAAVQECRHNARRPAIMTALLDAVLLPSLFDCAAEDAAQRLAVHEEGGPLHLFLGELFAACEKSPQAMAITAVHLCGLWVQHPDIALLYLSFWERLLLYGSPDTGTLKASDLSSEAEFFSEPGNLCIDPDVQEAYAGTDMAARVAAVAAVHQLATQSPPQPQHWFGSSAAAGTTDTERVGRALWRGLLERAGPGGDLGQPGHYVSGSAVHRSRVRAWQALAVLSKFAPADDIQTTFRTIWSSLQVDNNASVRQYQEAILVGLLLKHPELVEEYLLPVLSTYEHRGEGLASAVLMSAQVVLHAPKAVQGRLLLPVLTALLPWTLHHHHSLRTFAQLVVQELLERFPAGCGLPANAQLAAVQRFLAVNADLKRLRRSIGAGIAAFDPETASSPKGVFCVGVQMVGRPEDGPGIEGAPLALLERVTAFLAQERAKLRTELNAANTGPVEAEQQAPDRQRKAHPADKGDCSSAASSAAVARSLAVAETVLGEHAVSGKPPADAGSTERQGIIVVASLLDKAPNLAGLARTCEVFQASALVMADLRVLKDVAFMGVAMTAEQWVPLLQVTPRDLLPWLHNKHLQGYKIIGLEQTMESRPLPEFAFPAKSVLVLGREGTGIPANLMHVLDCCVEIPQLGLIRSLNVHVSGALAMYEYTRQQQRWKAAPAPDPPA